MAGPITEVTLRKVKEQVEKGNSVNYIRQSLGVSVSTIYSVMHTYNVRIDEIKRRRYEKRHHYQKVLLPEQWEGAEVFMEILHRLKAMRLDVRHHHIDMNALRRVWKLRMAQKVN